MDCSQAGSSKHLHSSDAVTLESRTEAQGTQSGQYEIAYFAGVIAAESAGSVPRQDKRIGARTGAQDRRGRFAVSEGEELDRPVEIDQLRVQPLELFGRLLAVEEERVQIGQLGRRSQPRCKEQVAECETLAADALVQVRCVEYGDRFPDERCRKRPVSVMNDNLRARGENRPSTLVRTL